MSDKNKCCGTCWHHRKQGSDWVCMNEHAENFALETEYSDGEDCDEYEEGNWKSGVAW